MRAVLSQEGLAVRSCARGHAQLPRLNSMAVKPANFQGKSTTLLCISSRNTVRSCAYQITDQIYVYRPDGMATLSRSARKLLGNTHR